MQPDLINLHDYEAAAEAALPAHLWDFIAGGAMDEVTLRRNRTAFEELALRPRYLRQVGEPELATTVLGCEISMPVFVSPAGMQTVAHPDGELATARAAGLAQTLMIVPSGVRRATHAEVAEAATGPLWLQLYHRDRATTEARVREVEAAGYRAICVTCDVPVASYKERDLRHGLAAFGGSRSPESLGFPVTWDDVEWLRGLTGLPLVLKGLNTAEDARLAVEHGASGILVSTHGGRLLDTTRSSIESLGEVVGAVDGRIEVYVDSGVRRGTDVLKALALGARAVGVGRPFFWGLAVGGAEGVHGMLELLRAELTLALRYCGQHSIHELDEALLHVPASWRTPCASA
jgi:4-hydroxymandelate oxidase